MESKFVVRIKKLMKLIGDAKGYYSPFLVMT
jgi:hypothetical protein